MKKRNMIRERVLGSNIILSLICFGFIAFWLGVGFAFIQIMAIATILILVGFLLSLVGEILAIMRLRKDKHRITIVAVIIGFLNLITFIWMLSSF